jgi:hypothetical protein
LTILSVLGLDGLRQLDELSDRNIVWYNRDELERINKGMYSTLDHRARRRMQLHGILFKTHDTMHQFTWELTAKGKRILESLDT